MEDYLLDLIYKEMYNKCESLEEKKEYLQYIIDELEDVINDINNNPWEYE